VPAGDDAFPELFLRDVTPTSATIDIGQIPPSIETCLKTMLRGEIVQLRLSSSEYGWKEEDFPSFPVSSFFYISLLGFTLLPERHQIGAEQKLIRFEELKIDGNECLKGGQLARALRRYDAAIAMVEPVSYAASPGSLVKPTQGNIEEAQVKWRLCLLNRAQCHLNLGDSQHAIDDCTAVLTKEPENVKALFRRGLGLLNLASYEEASIDFRDVIKFDKENVGAKRKLKECKEAIATLKAAGTFQSNPFQGALLGNSDKGEGETVKTTGEEVKKAKVVSQEEKSESKKVVSCLKEYLTSDGGVWGNEVNVDLETALSLDPHNSEALSMRGELYALNDLKEAAHESWREALVASRNNTDSLFALSLAHLESREFDKAIGLVDRYLVLTQPCYQKPDSDSGTDTCTCISLMLEEALSQLSPDDATMVPLLSLKAMLAIGDEREDSAALFQEAAELNMKAVLGSGGGLRDVSPDYWVRVGWCRARQGEWDLALSAYHCALKLPRGKGSWMTWERLACCYVKLGNGLQAAKTILEGLSLISPNGRDSTCINSHADKALWEFLERVLNQLGQRLFLERLRSRDLAAFRPLFCINGDPTSDALLEQ